MPGTFLITPVVVDPSDKPRTSPWGFCRALSPFEDPARKPGPDIISQSMYSLRRAVKEISLSLKRKKN